MAYFLLCQVNEVLFYLVTEHQSEACSIHTESINANFLFAAQSNHKDIIFQFIPPFLYHGFRIKSYVIFMVTLENHG